MPQNVGTTRVMMSPETMAGPPGAKFMETVQKAVGGEYQLLGELGRGAKGRIVYLARERSSNRLVALQLTPAEDSARGAPEMWLEVLRQLDANVPGVESNCPRCGATLRDWARFCGNCGADLSGLAPGGSAGAADSLLRAVKEAAGTRYEVLGQMDRAEGGGIVYFARERDSGRIVALRLQRSDGAPGAAEQYSLGVTRVISSLAESLGATYGSPAAAPNVRMAPTDQGREGRAPAAPSPPPVVADRTPGVSTASPPPTAQQTTPPESWWSVEANQRLALVLGGLALILVLTLVSVLSRSGGGGTTVAGGDSTAAGTVTVVDSAEVQIGGTLPEGTTVSVDGRRISGPSVKLAPGSYTFRARAPGRLASTQQIELRAGQTVIWTPQLVRTSREAGRR